MEQEHGRKERTRPLLLWDWNVELPEHEDRKLGLERKAGAALHGGTPFEVDRKLLKDVVREKMRREVYIPLRLSPYNTLGGEFSLMSKEAYGIPRTSVPHAILQHSHQAPQNRSRHLHISLLAPLHTDIGSLYFGPNPHLVASSNALVLVMSVSAAIAQRAAKVGASSTSEGKNVLDGVPRLKGEREHEYHVVPIISWPFFGATRGELIHPTELNRVPYCTSIRRRLSLRVKAEPGDELDRSDEWDLEESEEEWEGPVDRTYTDYRRMQRGALLAARLYKREENVRRKMEKRMRTMELFFWGGGLRAHRVAVKGRKRKRSLDWIVMI
ncbi:hypothetical protein BDQ17DRAFT_1329174 [Cyathus striatus]|nr:hypothetical protein BDQ17DRAFT_1329174 [Cyathus striatus]